MEVHTTADGTINNGQPDNTTSAVDLQINEDCKPQWKSNGYIEIGDSLLDDIKEEQEEENSEKVEEKLEAKDVDDDDEDEEDELRAIAEEAERRRRREEIGEPDVGDECEEDEVDKEGEGDPDADYTEDDEDASSFDSDSGNIPEKQYFLWAQGHDCLFSDKPPPLPRFVLEQCC